MNFRNVPLLPFYAIGARIIPEIKNWYSSQVFSFLLPSTTRLAGLEAQKNFHESVRPVRGRYAWNLQGFGARVMPFSLSCALAHWLSRGTERNSLDDNIAYPVLLTVSPLAVLALTPMPASLETCEV